MTFKESDKDTSDKSTTTKNDPKADAPKSADKPKSSSSSDKPKSESSSKITDATTGEELHTFHGRLSDGREFTVNARDEESARAVAREQGGGVNVFDIEKGKRPKKDES